MTLQAVTEVCGIANLMRISQKHYLEDIKVVALKGLPELLVSVLVTGCSCSSCALRPAHVASFMWKNPVRTLVESEWSIFG